MTAIINMVKRVNEMPDFKEMCDTIMKALPDELQDEAGAIIVEALLDIGEEFAERTDNPFDDVGMRALRAIAGRSGQD